MTSGREPQREPERPTSAQRSRAPRWAEVIRVERVTPRLVRVTVGGDGLAGFSAGAFTDHYVKLQFPPAGAAYGPPFDPAEIKERLAPEQWPVTRTYTARHWDPIQRQLTIDFVVHGDHGTAGRWADAAQPGERLQLQGPGGSYAPHPEAAWHLFVGDASALPAIAASVARVVPGADTRVLIELDHPEDPLGLSGLGDLQVTTVQSDGEGALLEAALRRLEFPTGTPQVFVHGEAESVRRVRRHLVVDRHLDPAGMSVSGYWKRHRTEDGWRTDKADWQRTLDADAAVNP